MLRKLSFGVLVILLCSMSLPIHAQNNNKYIIHNSRLTMEDGLITNTVLCGLQDSRGFIWFGTTEGLQRYDGKSFLLFTREKSGLQENKVGQMAEDKDGYLWLHYGSSNEALLRSGRRTDLLDTRTHSVRTLAQAFGAALPFPDSAAKWLFTDEQRDLFIITEDDAVWMYRGGGSFKKLFGSHFGQSFYPHGSLYQAWGGKLWLSSDTELVQIDTAGHVQRLHNPPGMQANCVFHLRADGSCTCIAQPVQATPREDLEYPAGLFEAGPNGEMKPLPRRFFPLPMPKARGGYLIEYRADVRTRGVVLHNPLIGLQLLTDSGAIQLMDTATLAAEAPLSPYAYFTDREGGHWLCTSLGVFRFRIAPAYFRNYLTRAQLPAATAVANQVRGIWDDGNGNIFVGRDALYKLSDNGRTAIRLNASHPLLVQSDEGHIWFSNDEEISRIGPDGKGLRTIRLPLPAGKAIWSSYRSRSSGRRFIGGDGYIGYISGDSAVALKPAAGATSGGTCYQFIEGGLEGLLAVTSAGIFKIKADTYVPFSRGQPSKRLLYIHQEATGDWWLCTAGDGLIRWNPATGAVKRWGIDEGLPSNTLYSCLPDGRGFFWISSNNGLVRFNPSTGAIKTFTRKDGLPDNEFNRISFFKAADGRLYFGGLNGITAFYPDAIPDNAGIRFSAPLRVITLQQFSAKEGRLIDKSAEFALRGSIDIQPDNSFLALDVLLLDYAAGTHRYDYRVEGFNNDWRTSGDGLIHLEQIPYGNYTLHIRAQNAEGAWSSEELQIPLRVVAPFYRKTAFIIGAGIAFLILLILATRARVRILERTNRRLEQSIGQRTQELRQSLAQKDVLMKEIHHRVKNNLQVISALQQMQAARSTDVHVKEALTAAQNRVLSIAFIHHNLYQRDDLKGVEMQSFVRELAVHILAVCTSPEDHISITQDIVLVTLDIDTAVPLGLIINELFTNSCKHAFNKREGNIFIRLHNEGNGGYILEYEDDGSGLDPVIDFQKVDSLGLKLINQLAEQLDGTLTYKRDTKSRFILRFRDFESRNKD